MCIRVVANGVGIVVLALICQWLYVHLMRGEYDSRLVWPFRGFRAKYPGSHVSAYVYLMKGEYA